MSQDTLRGRLAPCPFCGGEKMWVDQSGDPQGWVVHCMECDCRTGYEARREYAIAAWNKRPAALTGKDDPNGE